MDREAQWATIQAVDGGHPQVRGASIKYDPELLRGRSNGDGANVD